DILGTLARAATEQGQACTIATGDRDSLQLVTDRVTVLLAATRMGQPETAVYTPAAIEEKYGLTPAQLIDLKALMGDSSDCIPGVPGVGEKTALELLHTFGGLDALYERLDTAEMRESLRQKLRDGKDSAYLSRTLGTICTTVPMDTDVTHYAQKPVEREALAALFAKLEFFKWIEKMGLDVPVAPVQATAAADARTVAGQEALDEVIAYVSGHRTLDVLPEVEEGKVVALWVCLPDKSVRLTDFDALIPDLCGGAAVRTHDSKPLYAALLAAGHTPAEVTMDTRLAGYLLNPLASDYALVHLAQGYGIPLPEAEEGRDAAVFSAVADRLTREIEQSGQRKLLTEIEIPLALVLADMEREGFAADREGIAAFGEALEEKIADLQRAVYAEVGYEFNLNSPKQLGKALFEDMGLPHGKKTKTGYSTGADVLEKLRPLYPVVDNLLEYRMLAKLKSTYCDGLLKVFATDGRIHSSFNQTETRTGRISSTEPNLQNIPIRREVGREMRRFFRARDGWVLCDADYSQIELRVLAALSGDPTMTEAFRTGEDIHRITASQVFGVPESEVTPLMRSRAKAVNFGIVYGIGAHSLSEDIGVSYGEAKHYIEAYLAHYGAVSKFMDGLIEKAKESGYGQTLFGRRRPLPELRAGNAMTRAFGERVARNMPIQGTAADIIKIAMVRVDRRLKTEGLRAKLILQVHDEL
ncbi:MAG: DNA polymerase I, partial [Clostridia bacterium]|nr:DNA polymerase I [Clostridia bacterium]